MLKLKVLDKEISVIKLSSLTDAQNISGFFCLARTENEISLVCETPFAPTDTIAREDGWAAFYIDAALDFSLVGILADISAALKAAGIPLFALSTFDTDYILVKRENFNAALNALSAAGWAWD